MAQGLVHGMNKLKGKAGYFVLKVDLTKACDKLNWSFLEKVLIEVGLPNIMRTIIMEDVSTVKMAILWQGKKNPI